jgi:hypothetical protein
MNMQSSSKGKRAAVDDADKENSPEGSRNPPRNPSQINSNGVVTRGAKRVKTNSQVDLRDATPELASHESSEEVSLLILNFNIRMLT